MRGAGICGIHPRVSTIRDHLRISEPGRKGLKTGKFHDRGERVDPDRIERRVVAADLPLLGDVARYLVVAPGSPLAHKKCMVVTALDDHFIVDVLAPNVVAAGFRGMATRSARASARAATAHDITPFRLLPPALPSA
jgi:hypothetical protein